LSPAGPFHGRDAIAEAAGDLRLTVEDGRITRLVVTFD
jgi:hypothetical protein